MLEQETVDQGIRIVSSAVKCARCVHYFAASSQSNRQFVTFSQNCYGELAVLHWSTIFGSRTVEPTHHSSYFARDDVIRVSNGAIDSVEFKKYFLQKISKTDSEYTEFWNQAHKMRNKYVAHRDDLTGVSFPDIDICKEQCYAVLEVMRGLFAYSISAGDERDAVRQHHEYLDHSGAPQGVERESRIAIQGVSGLLV